MQPHNRYTEVYEPMREKAIHLQDQFHDFTGGNFKDPQASVLQHQLQQLLEDIDERRSPIGIDFRLKAIQNQLQVAKNSPQKFMNLEHYDYMHRNYETMRMDLHKFNQ